MTDEGDGSGGDAARDRPDDEAAERDDEADAGSEQPTTDADEVDDGLGEGDRGAAGDATREDPPVTDGPSGDDVIAIGEPTDTDDGDGSQDGERSPESDDAARPTESAGDGESAEPPADTPGNGGSQEAGSPGEPGPDDGPAGGQPVEDPAAAETTRADESVEGGRGTQGDGSAATAEGDHSEHASGAAESAPNEASAANEGMAPDDYTAAEATPDSESTPEVDDAPDHAPEDDPDVPEDVRTYDRFTKIDGGTYDRANEFLRERTYVTAREWAIARLCADFRTETGVEMTKIGEHLPELVPFMTDTYTPQAVNQARASFEEKVRKSGATFLYGAMSDFFTAEELDDVMYEATEVAKFLLEVEGVDLSVEDELEAEEGVSEVMREVREHSAALRHDEVICPECGHHVHPGEE